MPATPAPRDTLDAIETASRDEIAALQLERLSATLETAYERVEHYRRAFDAAGVHPRDLRSLDDQRREAQIVGPQGGAHPRGARADDEQVDLTIPTHARSFFLGDPDFSGLEHATA